MKVTKKRPALKLHRETLRSLSQLQQVVGGLTHPYCASVPPLVCDTTTLHTDCC